MMQTASPITQPRKRVSLVTPGIGNGCRRQRVDMCASGFVGDLGALANQCRRARGEIPRPARGENDILGLPVLSGRNPGSSRNETLRARRHLGKGSGRDGRVITSEVGSRRRGTASHPSAIGSCPGIPIARPQRYTSASRSRAAPRPLAGPKSGPPIKTWRQRAAFALSSICPTTSVGGPIAAMSKAFQPRRRRRPPPSPVGPALKLTSGRETIFASSGKGAVAWGIALAATKCS
ncbi:hypothetical protein SAMN05877831_11274 [Rhodobacter maris]|uniref:Uncharacterized protein n=1 Tax=Rhodobacter maris TaxID=446682 RepID=A0A285T0T1_9RHOB|nr:hypothetical protein SAMN05877831_11274 [Rhodobacter maris]